MRLGRSVRVSVLSLTAVFALGASGCTIEARVGGPVEPVNWHAGGPAGGGGSVHPVPAPAPMPNAPPPQQPPQPPAPTTNPPRRIARIPRPAPGGGTTTVAVPVARNTGLFGGPNDHAALKGLVYFVPESTMTFPDVSNMKPSALVYIDTLNIEWRDYTEGVGGTNRNEFYAIQYDGTFTAKGGKYTFFLESSDGSKLYIDDKLVVDNDGRHTPKRVGAETTLTPGQHTIRVDFFKAYRWVVALKLTVAPEGQPERVWTNSI